MDFFVLILVLRVHRREGLLLHGLQLDLVHLDLLLSLPELLLQAKVLAFQDCDFFLALLQESVRLLHPLVLLFYNPLQAVDLALFHR